MGFDTTLTRKEFMGSVAGGLVLPWLHSASAALHGPQQTGSAQADITTENLAAMEVLAGLNFSEEEREASLREVRGFRRQYESIRRLDINYNTPPATRFVADFSPPTQTEYIERVEYPWTQVPLPNPARPASDEDVAFMTVEELGGLIKNKKISSTELTNIYLKRLKEYGPKLLCVITLLEERALAEAKKTDEEMAKGIYRGPLHGIPYGIKDLFAVKGAPTTWGAEPYVDQVFDYDAEVVNRLREAGAVLCAKLSLGALAMNDHWFKGRTKNPWNPAQGSSGSSAGSASAMAAGLVAFTIGTETLGSIVSPSNRCRVTGLRPTFGKVNLYGAMPLSWTMDKAGPICRTAMDCSLVLAAIAPPQILGGYQANRYTDIRRLNLNTLRVGVLKGSADGEWTAVLRDMGVRPEEVEITPPGEGLTLGLSVEAAASFDTITRSGDVNTIQESMWPNIFRTHRYVPAVEYVQSLRARRLHQERFAEEMAEYDIVLAPDRGSHLLLTTNLTGHPQLYLPMSGTSGLSLIGQLHSESELCTLGWELQKRVKHHTKRPDLSKLDADG